MDICPNEYDKLQLSRSEKMFIRYASSFNGYGFLFLNTNPSMGASEKANIVIVDRGVLVLESSFKSVQSEMINKFIKIYFNNLYIFNKKTIIDKLKNNAALIDIDDGKLLFKFNYCCFFADIERKCIDRHLLTQEELYFVDNNCFFSDDLVECKYNFIDVIYKFLDKGEVTSDKCFLINDKNVNSVIQRLAPENVIVRVGNVSRTSSVKGVDDELLVVTPNDIPVKALRLDNEQINIVNKMQKGEQLILACAGSGKSVLLIAKCFKAAQMNPKKKFLLTCVSKKLQSLYNWYIDRAGFKEKNVECVTFHYLCKKLLEKNNLMVSSDIYQWPTQLIDKFNDSKIKDRYYGIFIDEIQQFEQEWYKLCFNLLENKDSNEHLFVICGDKTQRITVAQRRGQAPWNVGEGYPVYRGNKSIRIEKNYRNCIEINSFINNYVLEARKVLDSLPYNEETDPDLFLRGKSTRNGEKPIFKTLNEQSNKCEAKTVCESVEEIHDKYGVAYDEIAIITFNKEYKAQIKGWKDKHYILLDNIKKIFNYKGIDYFDMYESTDFNNNDGVAMLSFESSLGLDFKAVIVCGLAPLGYHDQTKNLSMSNLRIIDEEHTKSIQTDINRIYVACTRARDILYIIQPETSSFFMKMLHDASKGGYNE